MFSGMYLSSQSTSHAISNVKQNFKTKYGTQNSRSQLSKNGNANLNVQYDCVEKICENDKSNLSSTNSLCKLSSRDREHICDALNIIVGNVRHPRYATVEARAKTFERWPKQTVSVDKLAEAGFVYVLKDDIVECFDCGGGLRDWPDFADPWEQHALAFRTCPHVRRSKGDSFITKVNTTNGDCRKGDDSGYTAVDVLQTECVENTNVSGVAADECSKPSENKKVTLDAFTVDNLGKALVELSNVTNEDIKDGLTSEDTEDNNSDTDEETLANLESLKEENIQLKDPFTCKICCDRIACIITLPCGHMVSCFQCIPAVKSCAVCRTPIIGTVRAFMAVNCSNDQKIC
ncbi:Baculoviral IAP [Mactra antiquata]